MFLLLRCSFRCSRWIWSRHSPEDFHFANYRFSFRFVSLHFVSQTTVSPFCRQDVEHSPLAVGNTRRNATLPNVSQSIFLRKEIALLRKVVGESACYTSIYVFDTKRRTTRFKVRKALNNKFVCVFITCKVYRNWMLIKFTTGIKSIVIRRSPKPLVKSTLSIKTIA